VQALRVGADQNGRPCTQPAAALAFIRANRVKMEDNQSCGSATFALFLCSRLCNMPTKASAQGDRPGVPATARPAKDRKFLDHDP
jgi:hypothetical protein